MAMVMIEFAAARRGFVPIAFLVALLLPAISAGRPAFAQATTSGDDARIEERIKKVGPERPIAPEKDIKTPPVPAEAAPATPQSFSFVLSAVIIDGVTVFSAAQLASAYGDFLAKEVNADDIRTIAKRVTDMYREEGYIFSAAIVPPQEVVSGVVRLDVTEGYVEEVAFEGEGEVDGVIQSYVRPVMDERPVRLPTIERALLLINDLDGVSVQDSSVDDGSSPAAKKLVVRLDRSDFTGDLYLDNRGTPSSGRLQSWTSAAALGLTGPGSKAQLGLFTIPNQPEELVYVQGKYLQPVGGWGAKVELSVSGSLSDAGGTSAASDTESDSFRVTANLRQPIFRSRDQSLWAYAELDYYNVSENTFGSVNYDDRNRTARVGLEFYQSDFLAGDFYANAAYARGLDVLGATDDGDERLSRSDGSASFDKLSLELRRLQQLGAGFGLYTQTKGQIANRELLSAEEFSVGGGQYGRAYDYGEISGRRGIAGLVELRYTGENPTDWMDSYEFYSFYDAGAVWSSNAERASLASAGVGVRNTYAYGIYSDIQLAKPLTRPVDTTGNEDMRFLFSLGMTLSD